MAAVRADVSQLEIPLPHDQGLQNKSSHRRKKLPAQPLARGSGFNHTAGEVIGPGPAAEGLPRAWSSWVEGLGSPPLQAAGPGSPAEIPLRPAGKAAAQPRHSPFPSLTSASALTIVATSMCQRRNRGPEKWHQGLNDIQQVRFEHSNLVLKLRGAESPWILSKEGRKEINSKKPHSLVICLPPVESRGLGAWAGGLAGATRAGQQPARCGPCYLTEVSSARWGAIEAKGGGDWGKNGHKASGDMKGIAINNNVRSESSTSWEHGRPRSPALHPQLPGPAGHFPLNFV